MKMRRITLILLLAIPVGRASCGGEAADESRPELDPSQSELMPLLNREDFFELRRRLHGAEPETDLQQRFFLAAIQNAFNQPALSNQTIRGLREQVALTDASLWRLLQIQANNHFRLGEYRAAFEVSSELLGLPFPPGEERRLDEVQNLVRLLGAVADVPPQKVTRNGDSILVLSGDFHQMPVEIEGSRRQYILDTGANLSVLMRSEAMGLGLQIRQAEVQVGTSTDLEVAADIAVAGNLQIGNLQFENVLFMVFPDEALTFPEADFRIPGIIGFPVIEAMGEVRFRKGGTVEIPGEVPVRLQANLALDGLDPRIAIGYASDSFVCRLDTGANKTEFYSPFVDRYRPELAALHELQRSKSTGAGGSREFSAYVLPEVELVIGGATVVLEDVAAYSEPFSEEQNLFCNIGLDVLSQFSAYSINFRDMAFVLN